jgi:hypothetical protein
MDITLLIMGVVSAVLATGNLNTTSLLNIVNIFKDEIHRLFYGIETIITFLNSV